MKFFQIVFSTLIIIACDRNITISGSTMGTSYNITAYFHSREKLSKMIEDTLNDVNMKMSVFIKDSEISKINSSKKPMLLSRDLNLVVSTALDISKKTNGAYDITAAPLIDLWGFGTNSKSVPPRKIKIKNTLKNVGYKKVKLEDNLLTKLNTNITFNLSSIAKGFALDKIAENLNHLGVKDYLIDIGGELLIKGKPRSIGIENPLESGQPLKIIRLTSKAVATSGTYRNYYDYQNQKFHHIINPKNGNIVRSNLLSVTVIHSSCMLADAWATALLASGSKAISIANKNKLAAYLIFTEKDQLIEKKSALFNY